MRYERIKYPDGQISVKLLEDPHKYDQLIIRERINSYEDLMFVVSISEVLRFNNYTNYFLEIPCLFGQRSDRRFNTTQSFDLKIICDILNSCEYKCIFITDAHSDIPFALLPKASKVSAVLWIEECLRDVGNTESLVLVSPDAGAYKKVFEYGDRFNLPVVAAVKHRDKDGR